MVKLDDVTTRGGYVSLTALVDQIADIVGYITTEPFGPNRPVFEIIRIEFEDGTRLPVYTKEGVVYAQSSGALNNFDHETLVELAREADPDAFEDAETDEDEDDDE